MKKQREHREVNKALLTFMILVGGKHDFWWQVPWLDRVEICEGRLTKRDLQPRTDLMRPAIDHRIDLMIRHTSRTADEEKVCQIEMIQWTGCPVEGDHWEDWLISG